MDSPGRAAPEDSEDLFRVEAPAPGIATDEDVEVAARDRLLVGFQIPLPE